MRKASLQVRANKGSAGVDGMSVDDLPEFFKEHQDKIATAVCNGKYLPQPILGAAAAQLKFPKAMVRNAF
jgi:RNA-directed DNA polymerase